MTKTKTIKVTACQCDRGVHLWQIPDDKQLPSTCGKCKSRKWNEGKREVKVK